MKNAKFVLTAITVLILVGIAFLLHKSQLNEPQKLLLEKAGLLKAQIVTDDVIEEIGESPAGTVGNAVLISVCDGNNRAKVYLGTGDSLSKAWDKSLDNAVKAYKPDSSSPIWVRADIVTNSWPVIGMNLQSDLNNDPAGFDFNGLALYNDFEFALLEGELNGRGIYDYENSNLSLAKLNEWLSDNGISPLSDIPAMMTAFETWGWVCDENNAVYSLIHDGIDEGADNGRRQVSMIDADYVKNIIDTASLYLMKQVKEDGNFIYGYYPQNDKEINHYNILRHSGTIWSLICRYRMFPDDGLRAIIENTIEYLVSQVRYDDTGAAYLYEAEDYEFKLGGNGIAVVSLTEYMDVFENEKYRDVCEALGMGIIAQQDPESGRYWHVLNGDFSRAEEFRTVYYDGECTFALARLYSLTGDQKWLDAACKAIDHFIENDYTQYRDHWVAYSLNEVTKYVNKKEYYDFALANATNNYERIQGRKRTYPTNLELLISAFETWQRMVEKGIDTGAFNVKDLLDVISARVNRQLSGYFYPELAMYMKNPQRILGSFMMRDDKFRVRIDDVQHNIGGFYLYWKNYDAMMAAGLDSNCAG